MWVKMTITNREKRYRLIGFGKYASGFELVNKNIDRLEDLCCAKMSYEQMEFYMTARKGIEFDVDLSKLHIRVISACVLSMNAILGADFLKILASVFTN